MALGVFLAILTPALLIALLGYRQSHRTLTEMTFERRQAVAHLAAFAVKGRLDNLVEVGVSLADRMQVRAMVQQGKWNEAILLLTNAPSRLSHIERIFLTDRAGTLMANTPELPDVVGKNFAFRDWYQGVSKEWKPYVSEVYQRTAAPRHTVIAAAIPMKAEDGTVMGILVLQVRAETLADWAREINVGPSGFVYFVDQKGNAAVHPTFSAEDEIQNMSTVLPVQRALRGERGVMIAFNPVEQEERLSAYEPVPGYGWGVIAQQPVRDAFAPRAEALRDSLWVSSLLVLSSAVLACFVVVSLGKLQRSRQELAQANAFQRALLDSAGVSIISTDPNGVIRFLNRAGEQLLGYAAAELVGQATPAKIHDPQEVAERAAVLSRELGTEVAPGFEVFVARARRGLPDEREWTYLRKDGTRVPVSLTVTAVQDAAGALMGFLGIAADLTERKRLEGELNRYFSLAQDLFCIASFDGHFTRLNPAWERALGWSIGELLGKPFLDFVHPDDREATINASGRLAAGQEIVSFENRYRCRDGSYKWLLWSATPDVAQQTIFAVAYDVTERKRTDAEIKSLNEVLRKQAAELQTVNKELESFSYSVSHDLRAPLRHIQGYGQMLARELGDQISARARSHLKTITDASREMGELIDDLLAFSRMSRTDMKQSQMDLDALVQETLRGLEMATRGRNIVWKISPLPPVLGDAAMIKLALMNLLGNAVKYSRPRDPAEIEVRCTGAEDGFAVFLVRDNGVGFDMKYLHKLFGVFQRLHQHEEFEGTGIGLATVRRIIGRHGGRVWAESELNRGATFYFTLPPAEPNWNPPQKL